RGRGRSRADENDWQDLRVSRLRCGNARQLSGGRASTAAGDRLSLAGRIVLVTGAGTGIGAACAKRFAADGARVAVLGRRRDLIAATAAQIDGLAVVADAANSDEMRRAVRHVTERFGRIDVLIANAGGHGTGKA